MQHTRLYQALRQIWIMFSRKEISSPITPFMVQHYRAVDETPWTFNRSIESRVSTGSEVVMTAFQECILAT